MMAMVVAMKAAVERSGGTGAVMRHQKIFITECHPCRLSFKKHHRLLFIIRYLKIP